MKYTLFREQQLYVDVENAWAFFSSPYNLAKITPQDMGFTVLSTQNQGEIYEGMLIDYTVSPLFGIPLRWTTKITQVNPLVSFTDFQLKGPYKYWHHFHEFIPNEQGVLMRDTVEYELPFGILGDIAHRVLVKQKLAQIFNYRHQILEGLFSKT
ncbi:MAG: hypothetical protein EOO99_10955 [Pedobacter sp.]|nr:MAG: hypothetical protein EOO99_10955 [Pedobacter sp.]